MSLSPEALAVAACIVCGAYVAFGLTGFGSAVLSLPLLAHLMPLKAALSMMLLVDVTVGLLFSARVRKGIRLDELAWLAPFMLAGMGGGLVLLIGLPERALLGALGTFVLAYAAWGVVRRSAPHALSRAWCAPIGLAGGVFSTLFGTGGVLYAVYTSGRIRDKGELRATTAAAILISVSVRALMFAAAGLFLQQGVIASALLLAPAALLGLLAGSRLHERVSTPVVSRAMNALMIVAGLSLLARVAAG